MRISRILLISAMVCLTSNHVWAAELHLLTADYAPFYGPSLPNEGPIAEIVTEAYKKVGYEVKVKYVPWARAMADAESGKADGLLGAWYSKERAELFAYSDKLPGNEIVLFKRKGAEPQSFTNFSDLQPYKIGVVRGYVNPPGFDAANLRTEEANSDALNLTKLSKGRVDLILVDRALANYLLANELNQYRSGLEAIGPPLTIEYLYLLISKGTNNHVQKVDDFNRGLEVLTTEGGVEEIMKRHGLQ